MFDPSRLYSRNQRSSHSGQILRKKPMKTGGALSNDTVQEVIKILKHQGWTVQQGPIIHPKPPTPPPCPIPLPINFSYLISGNYYIFNSDTFLDDITTAEHIYLAADDNVGSGWQEIKEQIQDLKSNSEIIPDSGVVSYSVKNFIQYTYSNQSTSTTPVVYFTFSGSNMSINSSIALSIAYTGLNGTNNYMIWYPDLNGNVIGIRNNSVNPQYSQLLDSSQTEILSNYSDPTNLYENVITNENPNGVTLGSLQYQTQAVNRSCSLFFGALVHFEMILQCHYEIQYE